MTEYEMYSGAMIGVNVGNTFWQLDQHYEGLFDRGDRRRL